MLTEAGVAPLLIASAPLIRASSAGAFKEGAFLWYRPTPSPANLAALCSVETSGGIYGASVSV